jgi:hypothetical protein
MKPVKLVEKVVKIPGVVAAVAAEAKAAATKPIVKPFNKRNYEVHS